MALRTKTRATRCATPSRMPASSVQPAAETALDKIGTATEQIVSTVAATVGPALEDAKDKAKDVTNDAVKPAVEDAKDKALETYKETLVPLAAAALVEGKARGRTRRGQARCDRGAEEEPQAAQPADPARTRWARCLRLHEGHRQGRRPGLDARAATPAAPPTGPTPPQLRSTVRTPPRPHPCRRRRPSSRPTPDDARQAARRKTVSVLNRPDDPASPSRTTRTAPSRPASTPTIFDSVHPASHAEHRRGDQVDDVEKAMDRAPCLRQCRMPEAVAQDHAEDEQQQTAADDDGHHLEEGQPGADVLGDLGVPLGMLMGADAIRPTWATTARPRGRLRRPRRSRRRSATT